MREKWSLQRSELSIFSAFPFGFDRLPAHFISIVIKMCIKSFAIKVCATIKSFYMRSIFRCLLFVVCMTYDLFRQNVGQINFACLEKIVLSHWDHKCSANRNNGTPMKFICSVNCDKLYWYFYFGLRVIFATRFPFFFFLFRLLFFLSLVPFSNKLFIV